MAAPAIREAVTTLSSLKGLPSYQHLVDLINESTISWVNDIGNSLRAITDALSEQLAQSPKENAIISDALGTLRWHLKLVEDIRSIFATQEFPEKAPRINHINSVVNSARERVSAILLQDESRFISLLQSVLDRLNRKSDPDLLADARKLAALPMISANLKNPRAAELFTTLRARANA